MSPPCYKNCNAIKSWDWHMRSHASVWMVLGFEKKMLYKQDQDDSRFTLKTCAAQFPVLSLNGAVFIRCAILSNTRDFLSNKWDILSKAVVWEPPQNDYEACFSEDRYHGRFLEDVCLSARCRRCFLSYMLSLLKFSSPFWCSAAESHLFHVWDDVTQPGHATSEGKNSSVDVG